MKNNIRVRILRYIKYNIYLYIYNIITYQSKKIKLITTIIGYNKKLLIIYIITFLLI